MISEILTIFKADTSDMKSGLRDLKGEQKQLAETELHAAEARNKHLEDWTKGNGKAKASLEALKSSMMLVNKGLEMMGLEGSRVSEAFGSMSAVMSTIGGKGGILAGLATGLVYAVDALGDWQHEMNQARFVQEQFEAAQWKTKDAVTQGAEALRIAYMEMDQLAIKTALGTDAMKAFTDAYIQADMVARAPWFKEEFEGGWARKGQVMPMGDQGVGAFQSLYGGGPVGTPDINPFNYQDLDESGVRASNRIAARKEEIKLAREELAALERQWKSYDHGALSVGLYRQEQERLRAVINGTVGKGKPGRGDVSQYIGGVGLEEQATSSITGNRLLGFSVPGATATYSTEGEQALAQQASWKHIYDAEKQARDERDRMQGLANMREAQNVGQLEKIFGPIEEFEIYEQGFASLGSTFSAFSDAVGEGYAAIVTGQGSFSAAFKKAFADGLLAMGKSSVVSALRETALGVGALAIGSPTAAIHFKSAALHGAVAVAAGAAANALGAGSSAPAPAPSGGSSSGSAGGRTSGGGTVDKPGEKSERPIYILMGSAYDESTPRMRRVMANEAVEKALRERDD